MSVSVVLTVRGEDRFLEGAVLTVCEQHLRPIELIIVDDGIVWNATSVPKIQGLCRKHDLQLKLVKSISAGRGAALNTGLGASSSAYIAILDVDDRWHQRKLSVQFENMETTSNTVLGTDVIHLVERDVSTDFDFPEMDAANAAVIDITPEILRHCPLTHSSVLVSRELIEQIGGYDESRKSQLDWDMFARAVMEGASLRRIEAPLTMKRIHRGQSFEARGKLGFLARSVSLQWRIQREMKAPIWHLYFLFRRSLVWLLPRGLKWRLQSMQRKRNDLGFRR